MKIDDSWYRRPPEVPERELAGGVVVRVDRGRIVVALVREGGPEYVLPKGRLERGESSDAAAQREVGEETGIEDVTILTYLGLTERLNFARTHWNRIHVYLMLAATGRAGKPAAGIDAVEWFPLDALPAMFWPEQRRLLHEQRGQIERFVQGSERMKSAVRTQFGRRAGAYARSASHARDRDLDLLIARLNLRPDDHVLDVATGTGFTAVAVHPHVRRVVGLDLTHGMLQEARRVAGGMAIAWIEGDVEALPFRDGTFSVVTSRRAPHHFAHLDRAIAEMLRVLEPAGRIGIVDQISPEDPDGQRLMEALEVLRDPSHVRALPVSEWRAVLIRPDVTQTFVQVVEAKQSFDRWLDLADTEVERRRAIEDALRRASQQVLAQIGYEPAPERTVLKRWMVLVGRKGGKA